MKSKKRDIIVYNALFSVHTNALIHLDSMCSVVYSAETQQYKNWDFISYQVFIKDYDFFTRGYHLHE